MEILKYLILIALSIGIFGCVSKSLPYSKTPEGQASIKSKIAYDTELSKLRQKIREVLISRTQFHAEWIELLKPTPTYWIER
jgi:hypothetical protein